MRWQYNSSPQSANSSLGGTRHGRPPATRAARWCQVSTSIAFGVLSACTSFEEPDLPALSQENTCTADADCGMDGHCRDGMCVARAGAEQDITLRVTPAFLPDGSEPFPVQAELARVDGPRHHNVWLERAVPVTVLVRQGDVAVPSEIRFRETDVVPGMPSGSVTVTMDDGQLMVQVPLTRGSSYIVSVEPEDAAEKAPMTRTIETISEGDVLDFDYDRDFTTRRYELVGLKDDRSVVVQAIDPQTNRRISSTRETVGGLVELRFADPEAPYKLEMLANATPEQENTSDGCGTGIPLPSYTVDSGELEEDDTIKVNLPQLLAAIDYEGTVELCGDDHTLFTPEDVGSLQVSLRSTELLTDEDGTGQEVIPSFQTDTQATFHRGTGKLRFCTRALPGQYDVVVNPPAITGSCERLGDLVSCGCGIFAESRQLPSSRDKIGVALTLPTMASISGTLTTASGEPVVGATIEAAARNLAEGIDLAPGDRGVTSYNRSGQGTSDDNGSFRVPLDVGAYDVTIKPPAESGFAWLVLWDVLIGNRVEEFPRDLTMVAPIAVDGTIDYEGGDETDRSALSGAVIRSFTVVDDGSRAVHIGQATTNEAAGFMLLVAPLQREGWYPNGPTVP